MRKAVALARVVLGELALFVAITMAGFVLVGVIDLVFGFGSVDASVGVAIRNAGISLAALVVFGTARLPAGGRLFTGRASRATSGTVAVLTVVWGAFQVFSILFLWSSEFVEQDEDLISQLIIFAIPPLYMGLRWLEKRGLSAEPPSSSSIVGTAEIQGSSPVPYSAAKASGIARALVVLSVVVAIMFYLSFFGTYFFILASMSAMLSLLALWKVSPWAVTRILPPLLEPEVGKVRKAVNILFGVPARSGTRFYLEADVDRTSLQRSLRSRVFELLLTSLAVTFVLGRRYLLQIVQAPVSDEFIHIVSVVEVMVLSPILAVLIVAPVWVVQDAQVRYVDSSQASGRLDEQLRGGILNRVIGIVGFISGIEFTVELFRLHPQLSATNGVWPNDFVLYLDALVTLLFIGMFLVPVIYVICVIYLMRVHETVVNVLRELLGSRFAFCSTVAVLVEETRAGPAGS